MTKIREILAMPFVLLIYVLMKIIELIIGEKLQKKIECSECGHKGILKPLTNNK